MSEPKKPRKRKSNLSFEKIEGLAEQAKVSSKETCLGDGSHTIMRVYWKGRPFLIVTERGDSPYESHLPKYVIQSSPQNFLKVLWGEVHYVQEVKAVCEAAALEFEKYLTEWHNLPKTK